MAYTWGDLRYALGNRIEDIGNRLGIPEMNISEKIAGGPTYSTVGQAYAQSPSGGSVQGANTGSVYGPIYNGPQNTYNPNSSLPGGIPSGGGSPSGSAQSGPSGPSGPSELDVINREYSAYNDYLGSQENQANTNYQAQLSNLGGQRTTLQNTANTNLQNTVGDINTQQEQGRQNERLNLQKVRQLLQDLEQRNAAQGAISGGGSVSEALAERFGRTAQQNVGGVLTEGQGLQNSLETEKVKANQFYNTKLSEIDNWYNQEKSSADQTLQSNLSSIQGARMESASAKVRATLDAWKGYINNVNQAQLQAAQFKAQYDTWKMQIDAQLGQYKPQQYAQPDYAKYMQFLSPTGQVTNSYSVDSNLYRTKPYNQEDQPIGLTG